MTPSLLQRLISESTAFSVPRGLDRSKTSHPAHPIQLYGLVYCCLLAPDQVLADAFGSALHSLGGDLKPGQQCDLPTTVIEGSFRSHHRQHSPHAGRQIFVFNVQFDVEGDLALATV